MAHTSELDQLLARTSLFGCLPPQEREATARQMHAHTFEQGEAIFARGDKAGEVYIVAEGRVRLSILSAEGRELSFSNIGPGTVFGEIAALDGGTRTADATALSHVKLFSLAKTPMRRLVHTSDAFADAVITLLCGRIREADLQLEAVALHSVETRLARFLLGLLGQHPDLSNGGPRIIELGMSQSELALLLGASRPKVNTALAALEQHGAISRDDTRVTCHQESLKAIAMVE
jgi:CRP-like cAMP-binding protein